MALLTWSDDYLIGDLTIDTEHKELFRLINSFHNHWQENHDRKSIAAVLNQLINYAQMHFQHEEAIMEEAQYKKLIEHQAIHESLIDTIFKLHQEYSENHLHLEMDTMKFVRSWLVDHIVQNDYLFRDHLRRNKVDPDKEPVTEAQPSAAES